MFLDPSEQQRAALIGSLTDEAQLSSLASAPIDWLEVRADLVGDVDVDFLRSNFAGRLLYTLRSKREGGAGPNGVRRRGDRLANAAAAYDLVDLELDRDAVPELLERVPETKRLLSWHGGPVEIADLRTTLERMEEIPAACRKLVALAEQAGQEKATMELLLSLAAGGEPRRDVICFAMGEAGVWTRLVAPRLGAPAIYGYLDGQPAAPGQLSIRQLRGDFGLPVLPPVESCFGISGNPVAHSLSPRLHNRGYRELGVPALYLPFQAQRFGDFWLEVVESTLLERLSIPLRGLSVTAPFKSAALAVAGASSPLAQSIESANTLILSDGVWEAETTDPRGVVGPLEARGVELSAVRAAVVGCGGAGRAAAAGLRRSGAQVDLFNRSSERGVAASQRLGLPFATLDQLEPSGYDVIVQATSLGHSADDPLPFDVSGLGSHSVVVDLVYSSEPTPLLRAAHERGASTVDGREVLLHQAVDQFRAMTGEQYPFALGRELLGIESAPDLAPGVQA